ncbi:MAG: VWA domain-containing protein [Bacteroidetes bacterium]|nr:MAG: VWA domain-containing protein [Bacteroidota bacterium]
MSKLRVSILFLFPFHLFSQTMHGGLEFSRTEFNFPKAENWVSRVDTIEVTNSTNKKIHLLKQNDPKWFEIRYPAKSLDPGRTEVVEIIFSPKEKGKFNLSFPIYHSASQTPVNISFKGEILHFDEFSDAACPSFSKPNLKPVDFELEINVLDSATKKPLINSFLEITKGEYFSQHKTDENGTFKQRSSINYHIVLAEHAGYKSRFAAKHINPKNRKITLELPPLLVPLTAASTGSITANPDTASLTDTVVPIATANTTFSLTDYKKNNIVFLIDKSSSMNKPNCMPLLQSAMTQLANMARYEDRITILTYANEAKLVLPGTPGSDHEKIIAVINQLKCGGRTEGGKAIQAAYKNAEDNFIKGGMNQIIIATDGGFNGISENETELMELVGAKVKEEIKLSVLAFGQNRFGKAHLIRLAKQGEGLYIFVSNEEDANLKLTETVRLQSKIK